MLHLHSLHPDYSTGCYSSHCIFILIPVLRCSRCKFEPNDQPWRTELLSWDTASQTLLKLRNLLTDKFQLMDQFKQNRPMPLTQPYIYIYANILASARNEPPWIIMRIFLAYSDSRAIQKRKVENRKIENRHPKDWILKIESIKPSNQKIWIEHKADQIHSTLATWTNIFTPGSLWRAGTTTEQLTNYRDITNKTTMEIKHILSSCSRVIPTTSNGCGQ